MSPRTADHRGSRRKTRRRPSKRPSVDPLWFKDAIIYQLHVRSFQDSNGDGIGDFRGLARRLDYIQDLGVTAIWLLPFYPSPLRDDGYDIADYGDVNPSYGTLSDFQEFLRLAHARGLQVITELVVNHTSDQHPWFERARRAKPGSKWRDFYVWNDTTDKYADARIIFKDFETSNWSWDPVAESHYWHRFYSHQPDLNYESPHVQKAVLEALDFWLDMGVDGMRLDAVPYLYEREGTNCENLPETHGFLKKLRRHVDSRHEARMMLAEANQWPEDAVAYFGEGDECHMCFHFPVMPRLFMALRMEDRYPIIDILNQTPPIPDNCQWAIFLRNHDELTLEMVTDEERDYMYRVYAHDRQARINLGIRRRLAPLLNNDRRRIELMNGLLFSLPGTPIVYYGDEIGMGDNFYLGDRNGVRTPMQWSDDRNAGFSRGRPHSLFLPTIIDPEYHYEKVNVDAQQKNPSSLLWWMKRLIGLRRRHQAFSRGTLEFLTPENAKVLCFVRRHEDERILVVANLSRFVQCAELDLSEFEGQRPVELFGRTRFPRIGELPYFLTLGPHSFYWFSLEEEEEPVHDERRELPVIEVEKEWQQVRKGRSRERLEAALPPFLRGRRWFGGKARTVQDVSLVDAVPLASGELHPVLWVLARVTYVEGEPETYLLALGLTPTLPGEDLPEDVATSGVATVRFANGSEGVLHDVFGRRDASLTVLDAIERRRKLKGDEGRVQGRTTRVFRKLRGPRKEVLEPHVLRAEQSNTSVIYGERLVLKLFRRVEPGQNPDLEVGRFLTERRSFNHVPPVAGQLEYERDGEEPTTLGILQAYVPNQGDAWRYALDSLGRYFERVLTSRSGAEDLPEPPEAPGDVVEAAASEPPSEAYERIGTFLGAAVLLGQRTGELHLALGSDPETSEFAPEGFSALYQRSLYQSMRTLSGRNLQLLDSRVRQLPAEVRPDARRVLASQPAILERFRRLTGKRLSAQRVRIHGDYHLGQVLHTGSDFVIIDFEGEPARSLSERKLKRSPMQDVAGMLRSFHYASQAALLRQEHQGILHEQDRERLESWAAYWRSWANVGFLHGYLGAVGDTPLLPRDPGDLALLLDVFRLEKAVYELGYELNNRPDWVRIPLAGILDLLGDAEERP